MCSIMLNPTCKNVSLLEVIGETKKNDEDTICDSIRTDVVDLHPTIKGRIPQGTSIQTVKWMRFQVQPRHSNAKELTGFHWVLGVIGETKKMIIKRRTSSRKLI